MKKVFKVNLTKWLRKYIEHIFVIEFIGSKWNDSLLTQKFEDRRQ